MAGFSLCSSEYNSRKYVLVSFLAGKKMEQKDNTISKYSYLMLTVVTCLLFIFLHINFPKLWNCTCQVCHNFLSFLILFRLGITYQSLYWIFVLVAAPLPDSQLDVMIADSLKDIPSDDDISVDENDPDLLVSIC